MPALASRSRGGRGRRMVNEINVVPYIDVMLVLLVIFMVTAPLVPPGAIDLPRAGQSSARVDAYIEVQVFADGSMGIRTSNTGDPAERRIARENLEESVRGLQAEHGEGTPVVISGDRSVRYERVIEVLGDLQRMNVGRVALMVKPGE
jgi:biopolymer transport protein TolR